MSAQQAAFALHSKPHVHIGGEECPWCEQPIPNEKFVEISKRIALKERQQLEEADARHTAELQKREAAALELGRKQAEAAMEARLAEAAEAGRVAAEREASLRSALDQSRADHSGAVARMAAEFAVREAAVREEAHRALDDAYAVRVAEAQSAKAAAEQRLAEHEAGRERELKAVLDEQREALERQGQAAVNAVLAKAFEDKQKLETAVLDLQRKLERKSNEELGEGAEVRLFEALKAEFPEDKIARVEKGAAGADVVHEIFSNGMPCGTIVYDSKNRSAWRNDYIGKLRADQIEARADHAVLSSNVFPAGVKQLHIQDGVIVCNPARALVIANILRRHIIQTRALRVGNEQRTRKTEELYAFITSDRCAQFLDDISGRAGDMEDLDGKEKKAHEAIWKKRAELIRAVERSRGQLSDEIERIIGIGRLGS